MSSKVKKLPAGSCKDDQSKHQLWKFRVAREDLGKLQSLSRGLHTGLYDEVAVADLKSGSQITKSGIDLNACVSPSPEPSVRKSRSPA